MYVKVVLAPTRVNKLKKPKESLFSIKLKDSAKEIYGLRLDKLRIQSKVSAPVLVSNGIFIANTGKLVNTAQIKGSFSPLGFNEKKKNRTVKIIAKIKLNKAVFAKSLTGSEPSK